MKIRNNLRQVRRCKDITQQRLAEIAQCSISAVRKLEAGSVPSVIMSRKIATALGCTVAEIWPETK